MKKADWKSVCEKMTLSDGTFWPVPVTLDVPAAGAKTIKAGEEVALVRKGEIMATMKVEEVYEMTEADKSGNANWSSRAPAPTLKSSGKWPPNDHPGVKMVLAQANSTSLAP